MIQRSMPLRLIFQHGSNFPGESDNCPSGKVSLKLILVVVDDFVKGK